MQIACLVLAFLGLATAQSVGAGWEVVPLTDEAYTTFEPQAFDVHNFNKTLYTVTQLPDYVLASTGPSIRPPAPANLTNNLFDYCGDAGHPIFGKSIWCTPIQDAGYDQSQCTVSYRVPGTPTQDPLQTTRINTFIYDNNCVRLHGCDLGKVKDGRWWSTYSDLRYTLDSVDQGNNPPHFRYADVDCKWPDCKDWKFFSIELVGSATVFIFHRSFTCNQP